ncbi:MAG TPA: ORF6N domain-containing protein [Verrucomicrobiae bacterium]|nr:ORF6N domain-containing protein [Verrucomicrobiae bacterium]
MAYQTNLAAPPQIEQAILLIRGQRVILERDLAAMYGVTTGNLNKAVRRNLDRFPADFIFQLTAEEAETSRFQNGILKRNMNIKKLQSRARHSMRAALKF